MYLLLIFTIHPSYNEQKSSCLRVIYCWIQEKEGWITKALCYLILH